MTVDYEAGNHAPSEGKFKAILVGWILGTGSLFTWNSMLTIEHYYANLFPKHHPAIVLTLVYQPFALGTTVLLAYHDSNLNTRLRNLASFSIFFISSFLVLVLDLTTSGKGGIGAFVGVCVLSAAFGLADGHVQGGMVGDLSLMSPEYVQSFSGGLAASGAATSSLRLITKAAFENSKDGLQKGALFFAISSAFEIFCVLVMPFLPEITNCEVL